MNNFKKIFILFSAILLSYSMMAQNDNSNFLEDGYKEPKKKQKTKDQTSLKDKLYFGGNFGFQFGNAVSSYELSPLIGYKIIDNLSAGVQLTYISVTDKRFAQEFKYNITGGRVFLRYQFTETFFAQAEYESLTFKFKGSSDKEQFNSTLVGAGYLFPMGQRSAFAITALYNLDYSENQSFYSSPLITRIGFIF